MKSRIHAVRAQADLTMAEFAKRIGMTTSSISLFESGKATPSDRTVLSICREFGVNEHWLRTGEGEMFEQTRETVLDRLAAEYSLDKEQVSVIENFLDLSPQERTLFLTQMRKVFGGPAAQPPRRVDVSRRCGRCRCQRAGRGSPVQRRAGRRGCQWGKRIFFHRLVLDRAAAEWRRKHQ